MDLGMQGRVVVVTGGARGIGRACCGLLREEGAIPVVWDCSLEGSEELSGYQVDITDEEAVKEATAATVEAFGGIQGLVHAAAVGSGKFGFPFTNLTPADWPRVLQINIQGMVHVAHAVAPVMQNACDGAMVFISSVAGQIGSQTDPPYSASKAANINFAQCLAKDLAGHNVRVNSVCPGMVQTDLNRSVWQAWHDSQPPDSRKTYEEWAGEKVKKVVPLQRWQTPPDIANMIVFLLSSRASEVTGQTINVDGGFVMHW